MLELLLLAVLVVLLGTCTVCRIRRTQRLAPGPQGVPIFGNYFQIDSERMQHYLTELSHTYGPIVRLSVLGTPVVSLATSGAIKRAFDAPPNDAHLNDRSVNSTKDIFFNRKHMGCANNTAQTMRLRDVHKVDVQTHFDGCERFEKVVRAEIETLTTSFIQTGCENFNPDPFLRTFYRNVCLILLVGEAAPENDPEQGLLWDFVDSLFHQVEPDIDGILKKFPCLKHLPGKYGCAYQNTKKARDGVIQKYFVVHKASYEHGKIRGLLDVCFKKQHEEAASKGSVWKDDDYIKGTMLDTLAAGMTELTKTVRMFVLLMCLHPDVQNRMRREIDIVIGRKSSPRTNHLSAMPYTQATILEILRYTSQTPLAIPHKADKDVILDDYLIEKGTIIFPNLWGVHHDKDVWGDPWTFRPSRFLDNKGRLLSSDNTLMQNVIPFSAGRRSCPGEKFAMSRSFLCLTSLLQKLQFLPAEKIPMPSPDPRKYSTKYPLSEPDFVCRVISRTPP